MRGRIHDTTEEQSEHALEAAGFEEMCEMPTGWKDVLPWLLKYIDDGLSCEVLCNAAAISHYTQKKETKMIHAPRAEEYFRLTKQNAEGIGMKINSLKTKLLCITVA